MDFVIEDGYNTSYMATLFMALFYSRSMIERYLLLENDNEKFDGLYLQKLIQHNFVDNVRKNLNITSKMLNEIRLCAITNGWMNDGDIFKAFGDAEPIDFLWFMLRLIRFRPMEFEGEKTNTEVDYEKMYVVKSQGGATCIKALYDEWAKNNSISNIPVMVLFQIDNILAEFNINKKITLFPKKHQYHNINWVFHSLFYNDGKSGYKTLMRDNDDLLIFNNNEFPNIKKITSAELSGMANKKIFIIYHKEPTV